MRGTDDHRREGAGHTADADRSGHAESQDHMGQQVDDRAGVDGDQVWIVVATPPIYALIGQSAAP